MKLVSLEDSTDEVITSRRHCTSLLTKLGRMVRIYVYSVVCVYVHTCTCIMLYKVIL